MNDFIPQGGFADVRVFGLPDGKEKIFTYRASESVSIGQMVRVPAPEWVERVTHETGLSGTVVREAQPTADYVYDLRDILPSAPAVAQLAPRTRQELVAHWRESAQAMRLKAETYDALAAELEATF